MSMDRIMMRWVRHVVRGEGKSRSDAGSERYTYRGPVLYSNDWPVARLVKGPGKDWVCVTKTGIWPKQPKEWKDDGKPTLNRHLVYVDCVGVFSKYDGDMVDDAKLHERTNWLAHCAAQRLIEQARTWPADKLITAYRNGRDTLKQDMATVINRYHQYSMTFSLGWPTFPDHYMRDLTDAIAMREKEYHDPKAEEQRIRQRARKDAKLALGL